MTCTKIIINFSNGTSTYVENPSLSVVLTLFHDVLLELGCVKVRQFFVGWNHYHIMIPKENQ